MFVVESNTSSTEPPLLANWAEEKEGEGGSDEDATIVIEFPLVYNTLYSREAFPDKIIRKSTIPGLVALNETVVESAELGRKTLPADVVESVLSIPSSDPKDGLKNIITN